MNLMNKHYKNFAENRKKNVKFNIKNLAVNFICFACWTFNFKMQRVEIKIV